MAKLKLLMQLLRVCAFCIPFLLLCLRTAQLNRPRTHRCNQFLSVFVAVIYCIPAMILADRVAVWVLKLIRFVTGLVSAVPVIGKLLSSLLNTMNAGTGLQLAANTAILLGFCLVKHLTIGLCEKLHNLFPDLYESLIDRFYERRAGEEYPFLQEGCKQLRQLFLVFYITFIALGVLDMGLCLLYPKNVLTSFPAYPVFGIIIMGECAFFLGGLTRREAAADAGTDEDSEEPPLEHERLRDDLSELLGDRLLYNDDRPAAERPERPEGHTRIEELCTGESGIEQITGSYFRHMQESGEIPEPDYVSASLRLMQDESVLFCNPFYRDLTPYLMLPVLHHLLNHKRVLVVSGRASGDADAEDWLKQGLRDICNLDNLWQVDYLHREKDPMGKPLPDVGILSFNDLYDLDLQRSYQKFFEETVMVILLEPSNLMGTGQIGLRSVCRQCEAPGKKTVYAACDRNCDGLIDALSHTLRQPIVEVMASPLNRTRCYQMFWAAEGPGVVTRILPKVSRYLGFGTEVGTVGLKHHAARVYWYGGSRVPLADLRWNAMQYTPGICGYASLPAEQSELDDRFRFVNGIWQAGRHERDTVVIVEDEFSNMFEIARAFAARNEHTGFLNVLTGSYLMRDYMRDNAELMENDPKAIPALCPDFARTEHNLALRLLLQMSAAPQEETAVRRELSLVGIHDHDVYRALTRLIREHTDLPESIVQPLYKTEEDPLGPGSVSKKYFTVSRDDFRTLYDTVLRPACFVIENEKSDTHFMGARMMGQVCQTLLPGQFFTYDGRHYEVLRITAEEGIIVRRAADHINGRSVYRQLRSYRLSGLTPTAPRQDLRGLSLQTLQGTVHVETDGYFAMDARDDFSTAHKVALNGEPVVRDYRAKQLLRVTLPGADAKILYTLCVLLNELFVTLYPGEEGFIVAATNAAVPEGDMCRALVPALHCEEEPAIYILEDCFIDLGISVSTERSFMRILEIITDFLDWYCDPRRERRGSKPGAPAQGSGEAEGAGEDGSLSAPGADDGFDGGDAPAEPAGESGETLTKPGKPAEDTGAEEGETLTKPQDTAASPLAKRTGYPVLRETAPDGSSVEGEDEELLTGHAPVPEHTLHEFLCYGGDADAEFLALNETLQYLVGYGFDLSALHRTRCNDPDMEEYIRHMEAGAHICDFCGAVMQPGEYDILKDGRERCPECSAQAVRRLKDAERLYFDTKAEMERTFGISIRTHVKVRVVSAKKIAKECGDEFNATKGFDPRTLGFARRSRSGAKYDLYLETGSPRDAMRSTMVHELTHIWQFENWTQEGNTLDDMMQQGKLPVIEGMAVWTEIQYLLCVGLKQRAERYAYNRLNEDSEYGEGLRTYAKKYKFSAGGSVSTRNTPFGHIPPL